MKVVASVRKRNVKNITALNLTVRKENIQKTREINADSKNYYNFISSNFMFEK
jgi:hypothetical protein